MVSGEPPRGRTIGLPGATSIGVGAIVGGGILALAGVAFANAGPAAIIAFAANGFIAVLTVLSFAELSTAFPESGGIYTFGRKVLSVESAFVFGWVVWFASIVAAVLYAIGFASYAVVAVDYLWRGNGGSPPGWLGSSWILTLLATGATVLYVLRLIQKTTGGGHWANIGKVIVFGLLIAGGLWKLLGVPFEGIRDQLRPFAPAGAAGIIKAMGYTFIALQGFDLVAAVAGEIRDPGRNVPRAMLYSLGIALAIYLPFLFVISTVGMQPGQSVTMLSREQPDAVIAIAVRNYLGSFGYWLVIVAAILAMLSALQANLLAASRVALTMARDRTLMHQLAVIREERRTPVNAILATAGIVILILVVVPNVAAAGAASSLIFLVTFALVHGLAVLARMRGGTQQAPFRIPWFPYVPTAGASACIALALFQGIAVPTAGMIIAAWLCFGGALYIFIFARRARVVDAAAEALDPDLTRLRGRSPLVLVPMANPANAEAMVGIANALAPPNVGRVLLLSVIAAPHEWKPGDPPQQLVDSQAVLRQALTASFAAGLSPEALTTVSPTPWTEIARVCRTHRCESLLLGLGALTEEVVESHLERLVSTVDCDVVFLRAREGWRLSDVERVLVAVGGRGDHDLLRARLLGSLYRTGAREIGFLRVFPEKAPDEAFSRAQRELDRLAQDELPGHSHAKVVRSDSVSDVILRHAAESDLVILGLQRLGRRQKVFGNIAVRVAQRLACPVIMISRRG